MTEPTSKLLVGTREGANYFGVTQETLRKWIKSGEIPGYWVGSRIKINIAESEQMILSRAGDA